MKEKEKKSAEKSVQHDEEQPKRSIFRITAIVLTVLLIVAIVVQAIVLIAIKIKADDYNRKNEQLESAYLVEQPEDFFGEIVIDELRDFSAFHKF